MACRYQVWNREAGHTGILKGALECCGAASDASGLCPEHAAFVADAKCSEVSKLDQKFWYRVPVKRKAKLGPSSVKETILPPDAAGRALRVNLENATGSEAKKEAFAALEAYNHVRALKINEWRKPTWTAEDQARKDAAEAEQAAFMQRRADAEAKEVKRRADEWKDAQAKMPDTSRPAAEAIAEPDAETVCGFRFEYRAEGGSGFYWNGKRVASTREGLERMGPAILARVCK